MRKVSSLLCLCIGVVLLAACASGQATTIAPTPIASPPAGPPDSSLGIYFDAGTRSETSSSLYALNASDGAQRWRVEANATISPPILANGVVYLRENGVSAFKARDGTRLWHREMERTEVTVKTVVNGVVYGMAFSVEQRSVYALQATDGTVLWQTPISSVLERVADGVVYVGSVGSHTGLTALNASDGSLLWNYAVHEAVDVPDVVNGQTLVEVYTQPESPPEFVAALDSKTGKERWRYMPNEPAGVSEIGASSQLVYVISNDGQPGDPFNIVYGLSASDGSIKWRQQLKESPLFINRLEGATLYFCSLSGVATALNASDGRVEWHTSVVPSGPDDVNMQIFQGLLLVHYSFAGNQEGISVVNASDGSIKWHVETKSGLTIVGVTSSSLYVNSFPSDGTTAITAYKSSDGTVRWTYSGMNVQGDFAVLG